MPASRPTFTLDHYRTLAAFRRALRQFLQFSQEAARAAGLPAQQHQALLAIKGFPEREFVSVGELADHLLVKHHSAVGLVDRLAQRGLVRRRVAQADKRRMEIHLTARGEALIRKISAAHLAELRQIEPDLRQLLKTIEG